MAHGMYMIKVLALSTNNELLSYAACTHPTKGEALVIDGKRQVISSITHILKSGRDGGGTYYSLDHVRIVVAQ